MPRLNDGPVPWGEGGDELVVVGCVHFSQKNLRLAPGNREGRCGECGRRIVVGPSPRKLDAEPGVSVWTVCVRCLQANADPDAPSRLVPGGRAEVAAAFGLSPAAAEALIRPFEEIPIVEQDPDTLDGDGSR